MLPVSYAIRNLLRSPGRLAQMAIGSALVVLLICFAAAFGAGMDRSLAATGDAKNVIVLGTGSEESVERSEVPASAPGILAANIGGLADVHGQAAVSGEIYYNGVIKLNDQTTQAIIRGVTPMALAVHASVRLTAGHFPGPDEILVGARTHELLGCEAQDLAIGRSLGFEGRSYTISGRFIAPGSVLEAECWLDLTDMMAVTQRDTLSAVVLRLDTAELADVDLFTSARLDLEMVALAETDYYGKLAVFYTPITWMAWLTAVLIATGAIFGGLNTFYAAFAARISEFATLQALGFHRWMILVSLLQEGVLATITGTLLGLAAGLLLVDGLAVSFSTGVFVLTFSDTILFLGLATGAGLGLLGSLPPAWRCLATDLPKALRTS